MSYLQQTEDVSGGGLFAICSSKASSSTSECTQAGNRGSVCRCERISLPAMVHCTCATLESACSPSEMERVVGCQRFGLAP